MTAWWEGPLVGFDTETTGVDVTQDRIVTACVDSMMWLLDPGVPIPEGAAAVHGISTEKAQAEGEPPAPALDVIAGRLVAAWGDGVPVVAFNGCFDLSILDHELARHGLPTLPDRLGGTQMLVVDPLVIDRHVDRYRRGKRTLTAACTHYGVDLDEVDAHTSHGDAAAAVELARTIGAAHPQVGNVPIAALHELQRRWHAEWAEGFQAYLRGQGKDETIDGTWPLRPAPSVPEPPAVVRALELLADEAWCANAGIQADVRDVIVAALRDKAVAA